MTDRGDIVEILSVQPTGARGTAKPEILPRPVGLNTLRHSPQSSPRSSPQPLGCENQCYNGIVKWQDIQQKQGRSLHSLDKAGNMENRQKIEGSLKRTSASEENLLSSVSGGGYRLNDMTDVKQLAKMQEESEYDSRVQFSSLVLLGLYK